ncbi:MAG: M28 family peptidase [Rhodothermia bacterium]|nr:M28 family peptidase [Rhodothermia bacterium]
MTFSSLRISAQDSAGAPVKPVRDWSLLSKVSGLTLRAAGTWCLGLTLMLASTGTTMAQAPEPARNALVTPTAFDRPDVVGRYQSTITAEELAAHLYLFASDFFEGRATATRGQKLAAYYLASEYKRLGLTPKGSAEPDSQNLLETYMQPFPVYAERLKKTTLSARIGDETVATSVFGPASSDGHSYLASGSVAETVGPLVFAGYGISDPEYGYDDFKALREAGIDYESSWVLILRDEPLASPDSSRFATSDGGPSEWTRQPRLKHLSLYRRAGPRGVLVVGDTGPRAKKPFARVVDRQAEEITEIDDLSLSESISPFPYLPIHVISTDFANRLLAPAGVTVAQVQEQIDSELKPHVFAVPNIEVTGRITRGPVKLSTENVIAMIEGTDPELKDEYVVISSHYDHIGLTGDPDGDAVNNGADDDGSGVVAALEMAEAFRMAREDGYGPRRSVLFINFSGEEQGLLGSEYFADKDPVVPLDQIVTVLNMDMIGRIDPTYRGGTDDYVYVIGSRLISEELHTIAERVNQLTGRNLKLDERFNSRSDPNRFYARSDHWNFGKHGIPFIFFFTGTHEDYHEPGDEAHKILYDRLANISQLVFATAWQVANQDVPPEVTGRGFN